MSAMFAAGLPSITTRSACFPAAIDPVLFGRWLKPGVHVNAVGSGTPREAELDIDAVKRSRMFADNRDGVLGQCGEFLRAKAAGAVDDGHVLGSVGDVIVGKIPGRSSAEEITLFKSLGMAVEDLVSCEFILAEATLSFVGFGFAEPTPSWGVMLQGAGQAGTLAEAPWLLSPAAAIVFAVY